MRSLNELSIFLKANNANFEIIEHEMPILTVKDAEKYFDIKKSAPVFVLSTNNGFIAFILSSQHGKIDFKEIGAKLGYSKLKMADKKDIFNSIGYKIGSIPLIGHNLPCIFDNKLLQYDYIFGGSGDELHTLKISPKDIIKLNNIIKFL